MRLSDHWTTGIALDDNGNTVLTTRRVDIDDFRHSGKFPFRIDVVYSYRADTKGMPKDDEVPYIAQVEELLRPLVEKDKLAICTGNYLGGGKKYLVFYARNVDVFFDRLNDALADLPDLPLSFTCEEDPQWEEYTLMEEITDLTT